MVAIHVTCLLQIAYHPVKNLVVKKFGKKAAAKDWQKTLANVDFYRQLPIIDKQ